MLPTVHRFPATRLTKLTLEGLLLLSIACTAVVAAAESPSVLRLSASIELPGVPGNFDHFAYDSARQRLFLAAEDNGTIEVINVEQARRTESISGFKHPHSILVRPTSSDILVTDSDANASALISSSNLKKIRGLELAPGANCILFDAQRRRVYVTAGGDRVGEKTSTLQSVDPDTGKVLKSVKVDALHLQPMALDIGTGRLFVNVADQKVIGIYDRDTLARIGTWSMPKGEKNSPIAFDPQGHRVFVIASDPGILLELDSESGELVAWISTAADPDDMDFDSLSQRVFVPGDGALDVFDVSNPKQIKQIQQVNTGKDAKTGMLVKSARKYVVAVPALRAMPARVLIFDVVTDTK